MYIRKRVNVNACFYCLCFGEMFVSTKSKLVYDPSLQTITYTWKYFIEFLDHSFILTQTFCGKNIVYTNEKYVYSSIERYLFKNWIYILLYL